MTCSSASFPSSNWPPVSSPDHALEADLHRSRGSSGISLGAATFPRVNALELNNGIVPHLARLSEASLSITSRTIEGCPERKCGRNAQISVGLACNHCKPINICDRLAPVGWGAIHSNQQQRQSPPIQHARGLSQWNGRGTAGNLARSGESTCDIPILPTGQWAESYHARHIRNVRRPPRLILRCVRLQLTF